MGLYRFGVFELATERRALSARGKTLTLSARAFDILNLLVEHRHRILTKDEILRVVWQGMAVDENNLAVQISALRRTLAEQDDGIAYIATVSGRGYRFVAPVDDGEAAPPEKAPVILAPPAVRAPISFWSIRRPIAFAGLASALLVGLAWFVLHRPAGSAPPRLSIAVLPFRNLGADPQQSYLADAISDDLTTDLSQIPGSVVIARESADAYKGRAVPTEEIGRTLGVRYLLEGSLASDSTTLHINAQLIDAKTGGHLWASGFDVGRDALGNARTEIVRRLGTVLNYTLVQVESARSVRDRPDNPDALDLYLRGRSVLDSSNDVNSLKQAQALFEHAVSLSPGFADAQASLGSLLIQKIRTTDDPDEWGDHAQAIKAIDAALRASPQNPASIVANGELAEIDHRCDAARESFRLALSLQPNNLAAHVGLALCARQLGKMEDMIAELKTILLVDPAGPRIGSRQSLIGMGYLMLGKPADAIAWLTRAGARVPSGSTPDVNLGWREYRQLFLIAALQIGGMKPEAAAEYKSYAASRPHRTVWLLASYTSHALSVLPGNHAYCQALHDAGMPMYADEDVGKSDELAARSSNDFETTPMTVAGASLLRTAGLAALLRQQPRPVILDVGHGAAVIPGAKLVWAPGVWGNRDELLLTAASDVGASPASAIVVMGDGPFGYASYDAAGILVAHGFRNVLWYRGGEEAWAAAGGAGEDRRLP